MKLLAKGDVVKFVDGDVEREGQVLLVDRFHKTIDVEIDDQHKCVKVPAHHLKPESEGKLIYIYSLKGTTYFLSDLAVSLKFQ